MFIATLVASFALAGSPSASKLSSNVQYAMAFGLVEAFSQKKYEAPKEQEVKADTSQPLVPEALPAPVMKPREIEKRATDFIPADPSPDRLAQATSQEEILKRLERLEEENRRLRQQAQPNTPQTPPAQSGGPVAQRLPAQMVPGWRISLYEWNNEGNTSRSPMRVFQLRNQRITARLGQHPIRPGDRTYSRAERFQGSTNEMFVYKLEGWLNIREPGQYQLGWEVNCGFGHKCNLIARLGGQQIFGEFNRNYENRMLYQSRELAAGAYQYELVFNMSNNSFMKFAPDRVSLYPMIRGPNEPNFRDFGPDELVTQNDPRIPTGLPY